MEAGPSEARLGEQQDASGSTLFSQLSCVQCRSRKLKCDRRRPNCGRCAKQQETCSYPTSKQRSLGPRKTVQELEGRIEELETLLRNANISARGNNDPPTSAPYEPMLLDANLSNPEHILRQQDAPLQPFMSPGATEAQESATQLIGLGLFEQLPSFDIMDELLTIYFLKVHAGAPMLHQASYVAAIRLPPHMRPPICLQYIVMAAAAATSDTYRHLSEPYYQRARVYAEADELKGQGETFTTVQHVQCWCLISAYECHVYAMFTRASTSLCRAVRIAQMLKLHQLDSRELDQRIYAGLPPPRSNIEAEERRRTWWVVFLADRYLTSTTGWPSLIDERHIDTNLPSSDESFATGVEDTPIHLSQALRSLEEGHGAHLSSFAVRLLAANELLHTLDRTSHQTAMDGVNDVREGSYWKRHREIDANLTTLTLCLPERLYVAWNPHSLDAILVHICVNMATIHLHRTAMGLLEQHVPDPALMDHSRSRLLPAANNIVAVFRAAGVNVGTAMRNPILSFAAYMAGSVFLDMHMQAESRSIQSQQYKDNLDYLAQLLLFFGQSSPLVRANALQLAADMQRSGYDATMMDRVMEQVATSGGNASEIRIPGSTKKPMVFCPALTTITTPLDASSGASGSLVESARALVNTSSYEAPAGPSHFDTVSWRSTVSHMTTSSVLYAGSSNGLFSQLEGGSMQTSMAGI